jgi:mono/diheme cytochrome c family protein
MMNPYRLAGMLAGVAIAAFALRAGADAETFPAEQVKKGSEIYAQNCSPCHGPRMRDPDGAFDLRTFPKDDRDRFVTSVTKGKNQMPPWGGLFGPAEINALWAYISIGEN